VVRLAGVGALGVGTSTVSRVLSDDPIVSIRPETRERIRAAARDIEYLSMHGLRLAPALVEGSSPAAPPA
jgi:DNA-binding LacI/PurR family transcriptional regulator